MTIAFACDHGGFPFRDDILHYLKNGGYEVIDYGAQSFQELDDFPDYAGLVCTSLLEKKADRGILVCGTGVGMSIAANRYQGIYAVLAYSSEIAKISRSHNNTNVICFGSRTMNIEEVILSLSQFLNEPFIGGKYQARNDKIECSC